MCDNKFYDDYIKKYLPFNSMKIFTKAFTRLPAT